MRLTSQIQFHRSAIAILAATTVVSLGASAFAQRSTDAAALNELSQKFRREVQAKQTPLYFDLLKSTDPVQQALNNDPDIKLMYIRENGMPAYYTLDNLNASLTTRTYDVWPAGVGNGFYNLTGSTTAAGELAIWDGDGARPTHVEFGGRVTLMDGTPEHPHSTHVAGTMIGAGLNLSARGMSYQAPLRSYDWDNDTAEMAAAAANGLQISNHSYGFITGWFQNGATFYWYGDIFVSTTEDYGFGLYDGSAIDYDQIAYDAPYYLICVAAGNERDDTGPVNHQHFNGVGWVAATDFHPADGQSGGYDTISYFSNAKNILCVGACNDFPSGYTQPSDITLTAFTSWGPTDDGRIKPDIVANGASVFSASISGISNNFYQNMSGTSMATPNASGSINLVAQDYETVKGQSPWSSTLKALTINAADECGPADGPDYSNGWGLLNTHRMVDIVHAAVGADLGVLEATLNEDETDTYFFEITSPQDARVTIVWTDPAGPAGPIAVDNTDPKLVNDLDLRVEHIATATTTLPWRLDVAAPANAATRADNTVDNVEQVDIDTAPAGIYRVTVSHKSNLDPAGAQDYSLVYRGMHETQSTPVRGGGTPAFTLSAPYPSPVTGIATLDFTMGKAGRVSIAVYDVAGRRVASLLETSNRAAGPGSVRFDAGNVASGVYFVKMQTASQTLTKKITVVK